MKGPTLKIEPYSLELDPVVEVQLLLRWSYLYHICLLFLIPFETSYGHKIPTLLPLTTVSQFNFYSTLWKVLTDPVSVYNGHLPISLYLYLIYPNSSNLLVLWCLCLPSS